MGGKSGGTQTSTNTNTPWIGAQPALGNYYTGVSDWMYGPQIAPVQYPRALQAPAPVGGYSPGSKGGTSGGFAQDFGYTNPQTQNPTLGIQRTSQPQSQYNTSWMNPYSTVAPIAPTTQAAWGLQTQRALQGSPVSQAAQNLATNELSGNMLMPSFNAQFAPIAQQLGRTFNDITMPSINSTFSMAGRTGSGAQQNAISNAQNNLGQTLQSLAGNIYGQERGYQQQAMGMAPQLSNLDYTDIANLGAVGEGQRAYQQQLLSAPYTRLQQMGGLLQPGLGFGTSQTSQPLYKNPLSSGLGGALAGLQIGTELGGPGIGTAIGGGLGLLSGKA